MNDPPINETHQKTDRMAAPALKHDNTCFATGKEEEDHLNGAHSQHHHHHHHHNHNHQLEEEEEATMDLVDFQSLAETFQSSTALIISTSTFGSALFAVAVNQVNDPQEVVPGGPFSAQTVRVFVSLAWLSFALCLAVVGFAITFLKIAIKRRERLRWEDEKLKARSDGDSTMLGTTSGLGSAAAAAAAAAGGGSSNEPRIRHTNTTTTKDYSSGTPTVNKKDTPRYLHSVGMVVWSLLYGLITLAFIFLSLVLVAYVGVVGWVALGFACLVGVMSVVWLILEARERSLWVPKPKDGSTGEKA